MFARALPIILLFASAAARAAFPPTEKKPITDEYHGTPVIEDFRWLENDKDPAVQAWTAAQNGYSRAYLDALPDRAAIEAQLKDLFAKDTPSYGALRPSPGRLFSLKFQPPKQQRLLVSLASPNDLAGEKVIVNPNEMEPKGQVAIDWYFPSPDGALVAVCLSQHGSEAGSLHIYRSETGEALPDVVPRVQFPTGGGSVAWAPDGRSLFYTRYPAPGERAKEDASFYQQIYRHRLGEPAEKDAYSLGRDFPKIAEIDFHTSRSGRWVLAAVANGDGGEFSHYIYDFGAGERAAWRQVTRFGDGVKEAAFGCDDATLYLRSVKDAPRGKVLRLALGGELAQAQVMVPESEVVIEAMEPTRHFLYVADLVGGPSQVRRFSLEGEGQVLPLPKTAGIPQIIALEDQPDDDRLLLLETSYVEPSAWHLYDPNGGLAKTALVNTSPVDFSDIEAVRDFAISKDGTKVPLNILRKKGLAPDGTHPTLLYAYGGYGISMRPAFDFTRRLWFDRGGVYVIANIRGGGEYGEAWHLEGNLTKKQNVFDDFAACAQHLIDHGYTRPAKLATMGGSNGGLLMGAFLTQHPELARAVVTRVGIYDMLRVELESNGAFNVTEFGTVKDPAQFQALRAYSPLHQVKDGTKYPAVFLLTGANDGRVNPLQSRKMTARLQAATTSGLPVLLRLNSASGHGMGTALSERIAQEADIFAFLFDQLGMKAK